MDKQSESCDGCQENCSGNEEEIDFSEKLHPMSKVKKVICVVSGKGGVGKSLVTSMMGVTMNKMGYKTAILDADITGPSIPKIFGIHERAKAIENGILPIRTSKGIDIMSVNLLLDNVTDPVIWRGPIIAATVKQFWTDVIWEDIDYMFIDMPPGTGDVPLTVFQSIDIDGIIVVTSPQELVSMIVAKAVKMAEMMNVPILGLVENMSYFQCPDNGKKYKIFGDSHIDQVAKEHNLEVLAKIPIDPEISYACDRGQIELYNKDYLKDIGIKFQEIYDMAEESKDIDDNKRYRIAVASEGDKVTQHFGHCSNFNIYDIDNNVIINRTSIENPGHKPGFLPNFLSDKGVNVVISGGMGAGALDIFNEKNIKVIVGARGYSKDAVSQYLDGELESTNEVCNHK